MGMMVSRVRTIVLAAVLVLPGPLVAAEWVERSDAHARMLIAAQARFSPEMATSLGLAEFDREVADLGPGLDERRRRVLEEAMHQLQAELLNERDPNVRQDLMLMIDATRRQIEGIDVYGRHLLPYVDAPALVFRGVQALLQGGLPDARREAAADRLRRYVGLHEGADEADETVFAQARARFVERLDDRGLIGPPRSEVEQGIANAPTFVTGLRQLFEAEGVDASDALDALERQVGEHVDWVRETVLPRSRDEGQLPEELYAYNLRQFGIDIAPEQLMAAARTSFFEIREQMQRLAPRVAEAEGLDAGDYRDVIRALKREQLDEDEIEDYYRGVIEQIDVIIAREGIVDIPRRPVVMRLGTAAESAASPAPHFRPAPLIGNTGEQGQFVLPLGNPSADAGPEDSYDDFTFRAAAWTLSAHEARPGHELQFTSMIERGVSLARSLFARNSVNVEGWALYAEAEMVPHEPPAGQLIALQFRLMRAARAILDPMLNLGLIDRAGAERILLEEVVLSPAMARQELDRYQFRAPGQAGSYFYGYQRILELRTEAEFALGADFDRRAYNNFLLDQGMLPPGLLAEAVRTQFIAR